MEKELKEEKQLVLKRVPPGDRWIFAGAKPGQIQGLLRHLELRWKKD